MFRRKNFSRYTFISQIAKLFSIVLLLYFQKYFFTNNSLLPGDSRNYMPPILVPSSAKRIATQILVIAKLNRRKNFILRVFVCDIIRSSKKLPVQSSNLSTRIRCESCSTLRMSMITRFNINDVNGVVLVSLLLTVNIFQT